MNVQTSSFVLCAAGLLAAAKAMRGLVYISQGVLCTYSERLVAARDALCVAVSTSHLEFSAVLGAALEFTEAAMSLITLPDLSDIHAYLRKSEVLCGMHEFDCDAASTIASFQGAFIRLDFISQGFSTNSSMAHLESYEGELTPGPTILSNFRLIQFDSRGTRTPLGNEDSSVLVIKEHDIIVVKEGQTTVPAVRWRLEAGTKYPLRTGLFFSMGCANVVLEEVSEKTIVLRWRYGTENYSPPIEFHSDVKKRWLIGRSADSDVFISDRTVSSSHALVEFGDRRWTISDQNAFNGTYQYLHTSGTLGGESDEYLIRARGQVFIGKSSRVSVTNNS